MFFQLRFKFIALLLSLPVWANAFPSDYESLAGLSKDEVELFIRESGSKIQGAQPPPGPMKDTSSKLVNDAAHPYIAPGPNDIRGPCPGLNALASHGVSKFYDMSLDSYITICTSTSPDPA